MAITQRTLDLHRADGTQYPCHLAIPDGGRGPGLLLLHDAQGLDDHTKYLANLYAEEGWLVAAPDFAASTSSALKLSDVAATLTTLLTRPECSGTAGAVGHGVGASIALMLAAEVPTLACVVAYYPNAFESCPPLLGCEVAVLLHLASGESGTAAAVPSNWVEHRAIDIRHYAAPVGFDNPNAPGHNRSAHWLAKSRTLALLRERLGPVYDLGALWEAHLYSEFADRNVDVSMATMVDEPYVFVVPTVTGGTGKEKLHRWYSNHFHFQNPPDTTIIPISRTIGTDRLVDEFIFCFTHDRAMDWILPGVAPTGKYVEVPMTAVVNFRGPKLYHEHIAWDQATVLVQTGLLDPTGLPVTGIEQSKAMQDETLPRNRLIPGW